MGIGITNDTGADCVMEGIKMPALRMLRVVTLLATSMLGAWPATAADYAPLDCTKARSATERTICGNYALGQAEARMATLYEWTTQFVAMGQRGAMQDDQRAFIKEREQCKRRWPASSACTTAASISSRW
jgi:uncharacterized protein